MAKGSDIILTSPPRGVFLEGIVSGTPSPGTVMQIKAGAAPVGGRHTWEVYNPTSDGDPRLVAVLLPDQLQGGIATAAYVSGTRCFMYVPLAGEEINMLAAGEPGTGSANAFTIGERLEIQHATGLLIQQSSSAGSAPFQSMEHIDEVPNTATLVWCIRT